MHLKNITIKNFLSVGACTQAINLDKSDLTLIVGENLDLGGNGAKNGVGKTVMIQALSYALFGVSINAIKKDNLINRTNGKGMLVTLEFNVDGVDYRVERGRKPAVMKLYKNNKQLTAQGETSTDMRDDAQGENKDTQAEIERLINMSHDMFLQIVALNTYSEPFLSMKVSDQRLIIEQLLGITLLSEKADAIRLAIKNTKESIQAEEFKIKATQEANARIQVQIENLKQKHTQWSQRHEATISALVREYEQLALIDIQAELSAHVDVAKYLQYESLSTEFANIYAMSNKWIADSASKKVVLQKQYDQLLTIDIAAELQAHADIEKYNAVLLELQRHTANVTTLQNEVNGLQSSITKLEAKVTKLSDHKCYACGQDWHDANQLTEITEKTALLDTMRAELDVSVERLRVLKQTQIDVPVKPITHYKSINDAIKHDSQITHLQSTIETHEQQINPYQQQIDLLMTKIGACDVIVKPSTVYRTEREALQHTARVEQIIQEMEKLHGETNPYTDQISDMEINTLQQINYDTLNELNSYMNHQKFILDLLTNRDSFVRKRIIDQNLAYLNSRLSYYLGKIGLPHNVMFKNDLSVEITEFGRDLDYGNLSRGEGNRLVIALSLAFRDVWEHLYRPINSVFIDEIVDYGMDSVGVDNSIEILKSISRDRKKAVWLISHREELLSRVPNIMRVIKQNGFTAYEMS